MKNILVSDFIYLSRNKGILIDVRTPAEFFKGHICGAVNMPLFTDEERIVVGTIYKKQGKEKAVEKGLDYVGVRLSDYVKKAREIILSSGGNFYDTTLYIYCWRGGMRSNSLAWLLSTAGFKVEVLLGGYKAFRRSFLSKLKVNHWKFIVLGGPTGCGKTDILSALRDKGEQVVDLEAIAKHRGSAFGTYGYEGSQPSSEQFANMVYDTLLGFDNSKYVWCEGESMSIGKVFMPQELYVSIQNSKFVYFSLPRDIRLKHIVRDYGTCPKDLLIQSFSNISKRLGFDNAKNAIEFVEKGDLYSAADIALAYYDKGYSHSIEGRKGEIVDRVEMPSDEPLISAEKLIEIKNRYETNMN